MMEVLVIFLLIIVNGFFALSEIAFISSKRVKIIDEYKKGRKNAKIILNFMSQPEKFLSSIQVGITFVGIISGAFGGVAISEDVSLLLKNFKPISNFSGEISIVLTVGLITYLSIVIGELFPKTIALKNPEKILLRVIPVMNVFSRIFYPVVMFLSFSTRLLLKLFNMKYQNDKDENPIKEIISLTRLAVLNKKINKDQEKILFNTLNINKIMLRDIMIEIRDIKFLYSEMSLMEALIEAHIHHHTRYPLFDRTDGVIAGYINLKDIYSALQINPEFNSIKSISREILKFRDNEKVVDVLPVLMKKSQHIALVRNSDNGIIGLITLEDIIESIIGDITDEYELLPEFIFRITETRYIIGGGVKLSRLKKETGIDIPDSGGNISDWLIGLSGGKITPEKKIKYRSYEFIIRKIKRSSVNELILQK